MREGLCHDIALKPFRGGRKHRHHRRRGLSQPGRCKLSAQDPRGTTCRLPDHPHRHEPTASTPDHSVALSGHPLPALTDAQVAALLADTNCDRRPRADRHACDARRGQPAARIWSCPIRNSTPPALRCCSTSVSQMSTPCRWPSTLTSLWKPPAKTRRRDVPGCGRLCWRPPSSIDVSCGNWPGLPRAATK